MSSNTPLLISQVTQRRFILGKQGLYPGRRWRGKEGVAQAIHAGSVVQIDPLNVVARSHDIVLHGRVIDYQPAHLDTLLYTDRAAFDYGGTVIVHPMEELPYWRVVMSRKQNEARWVTFDTAHANIIDQVLSEVRERGPLGTRDISGGPIRTGSFRSGKLTGQALYYLWLAGNLMTHSRRGFERVYDLRERVAPVHLDYSASDDDADDYFALKIFQNSNMMTSRSWRNWFAGTVERKVEQSEAAERLDALLSEGKIVQIRLEEDPKTLRLILAEDFPLLERLHAGDLPDAWQPLDTSTEEEMTFLAPLEIVSTRGRALPLFGFEYLWEVYKPQEKRRWGYYTLPILYGDKLVARLDPRLDRPSRTLFIRGFWLEESTLVTKPFIAALAAAFRRFMQFVGAERLEFGALVPKEISDALRLP